MGWAWHVARIVHRKGAYLRDRDHLEDTRRWEDNIKIGVFKKYDGVRCKLD